MWGRWGYLNLIESMGLGMRKALKRRALKIMEWFFKGTDGRLGVGISFL